MRQVFWVPALACAVTLLQTTGCSIKPTIEQITDTTSNVTGTTSSGRSWFAEDGQLKPGSHTIAFVTVNRDNLTQDLAEGRGEYLASMGMLLGVSHNREQAFFSAAQARFALEGNPLASSPETLMALLEETARPFTR
ncbi:MAG TPA: DUF3015 family protein [Nitrospira sp.]|jgi:hypothetical protein|nr:DUF3015 family protein [Nitrospira sp.]